MPTNDPILTATWKANMDFISNPGILVLAFLMGHYVVRSLIPALSDARVAVWLHAPAAGSAPRACEDY